MINSVITVSGYQVTEQPTIHISTLDQLVWLRDRLNQLIVEHGKPADMGNYISATLARKLASDRGVEMHDNTLISACQRGVIPSARKNGRQWEFLSSDFDAFLRRLQQKRLAHRPVAIDYELIRNRLQEARQVEEMSFEEFSRQLERA